MTTNYIHAKKQLNDLLNPLGLEAFEIREIDVERDRWSQLLTTGRERDLHGQKGYITFRRKISDELELCFGVYFPRIDYAASPHKVLYVISNGKRIFDGIRRRLQNESIVGWVFTQKELAIFTEWYNNVSLRPADISNPH